MNRNNSWATVALVFCCIAATVSTVSSHPNHQRAPVVGYRVGDKLEFSRIEFIDKGGFNLKEYLGEKYVMMLFWSRYFTYYDDTLKLGSRIHSRYKGRNIAFLGINLDSSWEKVKKSLVVFDLSFPHTYNPYLTFPSKLLGTISQTGGSVIIIDKEGEVALLRKLINNEDYEEIQRFLDRNLMPSE